MTTDTLVVIRTVFTVLILVGILIAAVVYRNRRAVLSRLGASERAQPPPAGTPPQVQVLPVTIRETIIQGPVWAVYAVICLGVAMMLVRGCILPMVMPADAASEEEEADNAPASAPVVDAAATTPVAVPPTPPPPADWQASPPDWRADWVRLMNERIEGQYRIMADKGLAEQFTLEDLPPTVVISLEPGQARFAVPLFHGGHVWCTSSTDEVEYCAQSSSSLGWRWLQPNPFRCRSNNQNDILLLRAVGPTTVTVEQVMTDGQRHATDKAPKPYMCKIYRNVPGKSRVAVADGIVTQLPSGQRVDSTVRVLLFGAPNGIVLDATNPKAALAIQFGSPHWKKSGLKFTGTTTGRENPELLVSPVGDGLYDILVVLTPF